MANSKDYSFSLIGKLETNKSTTEINKNIKEIQSKMNKLVIEGKVDTKEYKELNKRFKELTKSSLSLEKLNTAQNKTANSVKILEKNTANATKAQLSLAKATRKSTEEVGFFETKLGKAVSSYVTFMSIHTVIDTSINSIKAMANEVIELDKSLTELKKVTDLEGASLDSFTKKAYAAAEGVARTGNEMVQSATEFAKSGYNENLSLELGKLALMYSNISDEEMSAGDSASFLIAQMKAFKIEAKNAISVLDIVNEVSNNYAVSSGDIATNLGKVSSLWANAGGTLEELTAVMTAGTEITRDASSMANAIKTLTNRLQGMNDEGEVDLEVKAKQEELFKKLNLSLYKQDGALKGVYEILNDLAPVYEKLDNAEKGYVTQTLAGIHQSGRLAAILNNWTTAQEALTTAQNSSGSAMKENEKYLDSIEGKTKGLESAFQELATSLIDSGLIKGVLDLGTGLLKIANSDGAKFISTVAFITAALSLGVKGFRLANTAINAYKTRLVAATLMSQGFSASQALMIGGNATLSMSFNALTAAMLANPLFWGAIAVTGVLGIISVIDKLTVTYEEQEEVVKALNQEYEDIKNKVSETESELEKVQKRLEELSKKDKLEIVEQEEVEKLKTENELLEKQIELLKKQAEIKKEEERKATVDLVNKTTEPSKDVKQAKLNATNIGTNIFTRISGGYLGNERTPVESFKENQEAINKLNGEIDRLKQKQNELNTETEEGNKEFEKIQKTIDGYNEDVTTLKNANIGLGVTFGEWIKKLEGGDEETEKLRQELITLQGQIETTNKTTQNAKGEAEEAIPTFEKYSETIDKVQSAYKTLEDATSQYNENGYVTLDTLQELLALDARYLAQLDLKNGKLSANTENEIAYANSLKETALSALQDAYAMDMHNLAIGETGKLSPLAKTALGNFSDKIDSTGNIAKAQAGNLFTYATGLEAIKAATEGKEFDENALRGKIDAISNAYNKAARNISNLKIGGGVTGSKAKSSSSKKAKEWWENQLEELKNQFKYSEITIEDYIDGLTGLLSKLKKGSDEWNQINEELQKQRLSKVKDDYSNSRISIEKYIESLENLQKAYKKNTEGWKSLDNEIKKARLDKLKSDYDDGRISLSKYIEELKKLQKQYKENTQSWLDLATEIKKALIDQQKEIKSQYDKAYNATERIIDKEIEKVQELRDEIEKKYNDEIEAKKKANESTKDEIELAELQERLEYARNNKSRRVWNEVKGTWEYRVDEKEVSTAEKELNDFLFDKEIEKLEEQKDAELEILDEKLKGWEKYKEQWANILNEYDDMINHKVLMDTLGADAEAKILAQRLDILKQFRDEYLKIQSQIGSLEGMSVNQASITGSYSSGGINTEAGLAKLHGTDTKPEVIFNSSQASKLFNWVQQLPQGVSNVNNTTYENKRIIHINRDIVLPNVKNGEDFLRELDMVVNLNE